MSSDQPSLPPKSSTPPVYSQIPPIPAKPNFSAPNTASHTPKPTPPPAISLPANFDNLPTHELQKLLVSVKELRGYVVGLLEPGIHQNIAKLDEITTRLKTYITRLQQLEESKTSVNTDLLKLDKLIQRWQSLQVEMFNVLQKKFSTESLHRSLTQLVNDTRLYSDQLHDGFVKNYDIDQHSEQSIQKFISNYKDSRKSYHLRNAKLQRLNENRVGGLY